MKIYLVAGSLNMGGAERVITNLANLWSRRGHEVTLISTYVHGGAPFYSIDEKVSFVSFSELLGPGMSSRFYKKILSLRRILKIGSPDVVISFLPNVNVLTLLASRGLRIPVVISERRDPGSQRFGFLLELMCRMTYWLSDAVVVQTSSAAVSVRSLYGRKLNVTVIPNPVPGRILGHRKVDFRSDQFSLISIGRLTSEKRVLEIVKAFHSIMDVVPSWSLNVFGDGPSRFEIEEYVRSKMIDHRVKLFGKSDEPWLAMERSDLFVLASEYEGFPNSLLEAMAVGIPCIAMDCNSGPADLIESGDVGRLIENGNWDRLVEAMLELMLSQDLRERLGRAARASVLEKYSEDKVSSLWAGLICSLVKKNE